MSRLMCQLSPLVREWGGSVNDVLTDVSTVLDKTAGCWCQLCPDAGHCHPDNKQKVPEHVFRDFFVKVTLVATGY